MNEQQRVDNVIANWNADRDRLRTRLAEAEARLAKVEAIKPLTGSEGVTFGAGFASGFNHALELVAEAIASVEPSPPEEGP